jgi:hypothetical protein
MPAPEVRVIASIIEWAAVATVIAVLVYAVKHAGWSGSHQPWRRCPGCGQPGCAHEERAGDFERWENEPTVTPGRPS